MLFQTFCSIPSHTGLFYLLNASYRNAVLPAAKCHETPRAVAVVSYSVEARAIPRACPGRRSRIADVISLLPYFDNSRQRIINNHNCHLPTMSLSDSSSALSSPPSSEDEADVTPMTKFTGLDRYFKPKTKAQSSERPAASPPPPKREPSPPHDYVLADNPDIAVGFQILQKNLLRRQITDQSRCVHSSSSCSARDSPKPSRDPALTLVPKILSAASPTQFLVN